MTRLEIEALVLLILIIGLLGGGYAWGSHHANVAAAARYGKLEAGYAQATAAAQTKAAAAQAAADHAALAQAAAATSAANAAVIRHTEDAAQAAAKVAQLADALRAARNPDVHLWVQQLLPPAALTGACTYDSSGHPAGAC